MSEQVRQGWVSVVIPTYNRAARLPATVASCLEQSHQSVEVIVVDDGSTDETPDVLAELASQWGPERLRAVSQVNQGAPTARNAGMALAQGEYLQLLDSDDLLTPDKFAQQIAALQRSGADAAVSDVLAVEDDAAHTPIRELHYDMDLRPRLGRYQHAHIAALLMRRSTYPAPLRWNTALHRFQDIDFVVRYLLSVEAWVHTPGFHVLYVLHEGPQISDTYAKGHQNREIYEGLKTYWDEAHALIPTRNHALVREAAMTLAFRAALQGQGADARAILRFAATGPGAASRAPKAGATTALSLVPSAALSAARRARHWVRDRLA